MECFAFGGATVRFASLETSFHAANHTIPPPPSYEGYPLCPKDKNLSLFHGERFLSIWRCHRPHWGGRRWCCGVADSSICLKSDCHSTNDRCEALASLKGCFFMFLFQSPSIFPLNRYFHMGQKKGGCLGGILPIFY
ncbi:MAG: hypothetical protein SPG72_08795 [Sodaliphilus sp.]|nr:hypothetical protein [Sodaliphilus sp.]